MGNKGSKPAEKIEPTEDGSVVDERSSGDRGGVIHIPVSNQASIRRKSPVLSSKSSKVPPKLSDPSDRLESPTGPGQLSTAEQPQKMIEICRSQPREERTVEEANVMTKTDYLFLMERLKTVSEAVRDINQRLIVVENQNKGSEAVREKPWESIECKNQPEMSPEDLIIKMKEQLKKRKPVQDTLEETRKLYKKIKSENTGPEQKAEPSMELIDNL